MQHISLGHAMAGAALIENGLGSTSLVKLCRLGNSKASICGVMANDITGNVSVLPAAAASKKLCGDFGGSKSNPGSMPL